MERVQFEEAASMAERMISHCLDVKRAPYLEPFILTASRREIASMKSLNESADTQSDYFGDCRHVLEDALRVVGAIEAYWSDVHHNGRPMRWLKIYDTLAVNGKSESFIVQIARDNAVWDFQKKGERAVWQEAWELHARDMTSRGGTWNVTPFSLVVAEGNRVDKIEGPERSDKLLRAHLCGGLEAAGKKTPVCYL